MNLLEIARSNYKENKIGYISIWLFIFITIVLCSIETFSLYYVWDGDRDFVRQNNLFSVYDYSEIKTSFKSCNVYILHYSCWIFITLSLCSCFVLSYFLSKKNTRLSLNRRSSNSYIIATQLFYLFLLGLLALWIDNVFIIDGGLYADDKDYTFSNAGHIFFMGDGFISLPFFTMSLLVHIVVISRIAKNSPSTSCIGVFYILFVILILLALSILIFFIWVRWEYEFGGNLL